jgi:hypothetical protein
MNYQQLMSLALVTYGEGDVEGALRGLDQALAAAEAIDPNGPRVAEVLQTRAQVQAASGQAAGARAALERVLAIYGRFEGLAEGQRALCLQLMSLSEELGDTEAALGWQARARALS